ncbi:MAG: PKD domain-containing protein [Myxococcota bacterium]|nr:PKD domain-containing protein [Myxococcota bacterium]
MRTVHLSLAVMTSWVLFTACSDPGLDAGGVALPEPVGETTDEGPSPCVSTNECGFGERCEAGWCVEDPGAADDDACLEDSDCPDGQVCSAATGACVDAESIGGDIDLDAPPECETGAVRPCGIKTGACEYGEQTCEDGRFGECVGGVGPVPEVCDGLDNDCDGDVDEEGSALCDDGLYCTGIEVCAMGQCQPGIAPSCDLMGGVCTDGVCDEETQGCVVVDLGDGTPCDDGNLCSQGSVCAAGVCEGGSPVDCAAAGDLCNVGVCNPESGACEPDAKPDGTACEDGAFCSVADSCQAGVCTPGVARDCSAAGSACTDGGACDEDADQCVGGTPLTGTPCDDGQFCTVGDTCDAGICLGAARDCDAEVGDSCNSGTCQEDVDMCLRVAVGDGSVCDDGSYCTVADSCTAGVCGGNARDCSAVGDQCNDGLCNEASDSCEPTPVMDGVACSDGMFCTVADSCIAGICDGEPRVCSGSGDQCNLDACDEAANTCTTTPVPDATPCSDGLFCTVDDVCTGGTCSGPAMDCSGIIRGPCQFGTCTEAAQGCDAVNEPNGTSCDDEIFCTAVDACLEGQCVGSGVTDCSGVTGGDICYDGLCDGSMDQCVAVDNGTCDPCETGSPVADAGPDQNAVPDQTIFLNGSGSSDPDGLALTYSWTVASRPDGSTAEISAPTAMNPTLLADLAGDFTVCLTVQDADSCVSQPDCMTITVAPQVNLHIELTWDTTNSDVDLHYRAAGGTFFDGYSSLLGCSWDSSDVYWCSTWPDWGSGGQGLPDGDYSNDPSLDVDNITGYGPENINQDNLFDTPSYTTVGVHYYWDKGGGPTNARIRIYVDGLLEFEAYQILNGPEFWEVADIVVSDNGTNVTISPLSGFIYDWYTPSGH